MENCEFLARLEAGLNSFDKFIKYPDGNLPTELSDAYPAAHDYILFLQGIQLPFYYMLSKFVNDSECIRSLFKDLLSRQSLVKNTLTSEEVYDVLFSLKETFGKDFVKNILESYAKFPSNIFSRITRALNDDKEQEFIAAIETADFTDFIKSIWLLRLVLFGVGEIKNNKLLKYGKWYDDYTLNFFFNNSFGICDDSYIESQIKIFLDNVDCNKKELWEYNDAMAYYSIYYKEDINGVCKFNSAVLNEQDLCARYKFDKSDFVYSDDSIDIYCEKYFRDFLAVALSSHKQLLISKIGENEVMKIESLCNDSDFPSNLLMSFVDDYLRIYVSKISVTYNIIKHFINPKHNGCLLQIFARFPVLKEAITGVNSLYNKYFENVFGTRLVNVTNKTSNKDNCAHNSAQLKNGEIPQLPKGDRRSPFIMGILNKKDNFDKLFRDVLHHLYLYLTADEAQENIASLQKNKKSIY